MSDMWHRYMFARLIWIWIAVWIAFFAHHWVSMSVQSWINLFLIHVLTYVRHINRLGAINNHIKRWKIVGLRSKIDYQATNVMFWSLTKAVIMTLLGSVLFEMCGFGIRLISANIALHIGNHLRHQYDKPHQVKVRESKEYIDNFLKKHGYWIKVSLGARFDNEVW